MVRDQHKEQETGVCVRDVSEVETARLGDSLSRGSGAGSSTCQVLANATRATKDRSWCRPVFEEVPAVQETVGGGHSRLELWGKREASTGRLKPGARGGVEEGSRGSGTWAEDRALGSAGRSAGPGRGAEKEQQRGRAGALGERMEKSRGQPRGMRHRGPHSRSKIKQPRSFWSPSMSKHLSRPLWRMSHSEGALRTGCPHS